MILPFSETLNGKPTYFVRKIWASARDCGQFINTPITSYTKDYLQRFGVIAPKSKDFTIIPKIHTIRRDRSDRWVKDRPIQFYINNRTKDMFKFMPDLKCTSVQTIEILNGSDVIVDGKKLGPLGVESLALNDGFDSVEDFFLYFSKDFTGKIIHWTNLTY